MNGWKAGVASADFEVPLGTPMAGFMARVGGSTGVLDPLTISVLVLEAGDQQFAIVAVDLLGVDREIVDEIEQRTGVEPGWLAVCASHTHSGPAGITKQVRNDPDAEISPELRERFISICSETVLQARVGLSHASLSYGSARAKGVSANRNSENGPFDPMVHVLRVRDRKRRPVATVVHFACHPTILPASSNLISADFPGAIRRALRNEKFGAVLFANGAAGDVSTRFTRQGQDEREVDRVGKEIAWAVERAEMSERTIDPKLQLEMIEVELEPRDSAEIRTIIADARGKLDEYSAADCDPAAKRIAETRAQGIEILERIAATLPDKPTKIAIPAWTVGDLFWYGIPGELFASLGELCTLGDDQFLVLGYTNGYLGYFADRAAYDDGLYEALASPFAPGASEAMVDRLLGDQ